MSSREKKGGGDFVLESRHLVGLFMLLVVIFGVVFTLVYLLGRSQYDTRLSAAVGKPLKDDPRISTPALKPKAKPESPDPAAPSPKNSDWDFYHPADPKPAEDHLQPPKKIVAAAETAAPLARQSSAASGKLAAAPANPVTPPNNSASAGN